MVPEVIPLSALVLMWNEVSAGLNGVARVTLIVDFAIVPPSSLPIESGPPAPGVVIEPRKKRFVPFIASSLVVVTKCATAAESLNGGAAVKRGGNATTPRRSMPAKKDGTPMTRGLRA